MRKRTTYRTLQVKDVQVEKLSEMVKNQKVIVGIDNAKEVAGTASKSNFDGFLAQTAQVSGAPVSDAQRADLFRAFLEWNKSQH